MDGKDVPYDLEHDFDGKAFYDAMRNGAEMATRISQRTLDKVMKKVGFLPR